MRKDIDERVAEQQRAQGSDELAKLDLIAGIDPFCSIDRSCVQNEEGHDSHLLAFVRPLWSVEFDSELHILRGGPTKQITFEEERQAQALLPKTSVLSQRGISASPVPEAPNAIPCGCIPARSPTARARGGGGRAPEEGPGAGPGACSLHLSERADWQYSQRELDAVEVFFSRTARDNRLGCMFVRCAPSSRYTLLFSHGNAVDLGQMCSFYIGLGSRINCNIFSYDYSGYGVSSGKPSEKNLYADIDAAWQALRTRYGVSPENIILYGQSIGTVPTVDLASRYECAAVILHSPLMSGLRVAFPDTRKTYCFDAFPSIDKISKVTSPVLVIHGTEDEVIDFSHGLAMYERCPRAVEPLWVEGAGHNDIELYAQYLERLKQFISHELPNS
ncbi:alpha/beta hydrolase domain-containing protein 17C [Orycteropus afer afer]|uniref:Alpha/beta hydrolase domain-containing protein 17C n=1 Tax=Orycteropus afer afer TaxID=1230840 RepID=A0A8B7A5P4_ORYAF|nr:alpha/beta hydrolase domain-containing protein 17C [Orycteropus afer afer]